MRKQILLIDDDLPLCRKLREALQDDTKEVRYFIDTAEALDSFMRHRYCLVIMDPVLEDMDGRELLRTMRRPRRSQFWCSPIRYHWKTKLPFFHLGHRSVRRSQLTCAAVLLRPMISSASIWSRNIQRKNIIP